MSESCEGFSEKEEKILSHFVTDTRKNVFVLRNLPEVIKGALFSRYSRSMLGLRELLLKDFILKEEMEFNKITAQKEESSQDEQIVAIQKAQEFYDRILDGYGDDSIGELGGAHLACENISMLGAKIIEDKRIGGSPLEKSTRYIRFNKKIDGKYRYYRDPKIAASSFAKDYEEVCDALFETYSDYIDPLMERMEAKYPIEEGTPPNAYKAALRARVFDTIRGLLPTATQTNLGVFGNGRFFENLLRSTASHDLAEMREFSQESYEELAKVIPSFIRRTHASHPNQKSYEKFEKAISEKMKAKADKLLTSNRSTETHAKVRLIDYDQDAVTKVLGALLFPHTGQSLYHIEDQVRGLSKNEIESIFRLMGDARENRRHKAPRAMERAFFTFEIETDFGAYRDLHRHRLLTQDRQRLTCNLGFDVPQELIDFGMEGPYIEVMKRAKAVFDVMVKEFPDEAQYVVPMGYNIRWFFHVNLRSLQWLCELRSSPAGHSSYRYIAQEMASQVMTTFPEFSHLLKYVDFGGYELGRLDQEVRKEKKQTATV